MKIEDVAVAVAVAVAVTVAPIEDERHQRRHLP
jgi:hypothetical protein